MIQQREFDEEDFEVSPLSKFVKMDDPTRNSRIFGKSPNSSAQNSQFNELMTPYSEMPNDPCTVHDIQRLTGNQEYTMRLNLSNKHSPSTDQRKEAASDQSTKKIRTAKKKRSLKRGFSECPSSPKPKMFERKKTVRAKKLINTLTEEDQSSYAQRESKLKKISQFNSMGNMDRWLKYPKALHKTKSQTKPHAVGSRKSMSMRSLMESGSNQSKGDPALQQWNTFDLDRPLQKSDAEMGFKRISQAPKEKTSHKSPPIVNIEPNRISFCVNNISGLASKLIIQSSSPESQSLQSESTPSVSLQAPPQMLLGDKTSKSKHGTSGQLNKQSTLKNKKKPKFFAEHDQKYNQSFRFKQGQTMEQPRDGSAGLGQSSIHFGSAVIHQMEPRQSVGFNETPKIGLMSPIERKPAVSPPVTVEDPSKLNFQVSEEKKKSRASKKSSFQESKLNSIESQLNQFEQLDNSVSSTLQTRRHNEEHKRISESTTSNPFIEKRKSKTLHPSMLRRMQESENELESDSTSQEIENQPPQRETRIFNRMATTPVYPELGDRGSSVSKNSQISRNSNIFHMQVTDRIMGLGRGGGGKRSQASQSPEGQQVLGQSNMFKSSDEVDASLNLRMENESSTGKNNKSLNSTNELHKPIISVGNLTLEDPKSSKQLMHSSTQNFYKLKLHQIGTTNEIQKKLQSSTNTPEIDNTKLSISIPWAGNKDSASHLHEKKEDDMMLEDLSACDNMSDYIYHQKKNNQQTSKLFQKRKRAANRKRESSKSIYSQFPEIRLGDQLDPLLNNSLRRKEPKTRINLVKMDDDDKKSIRRLVKNPSRFLDGVSQGYWGDDLGQISPGEINKQVDFKLPQHRTTLTLQLMKTEQPKKGKQTTPMKENESICNIENPAEFQLKEDLDSSLKPQIIHMPTATMDDFGETSPNFINFGSDGADYKVEEKPMDGTPKANKQPTIADMRKSSGKKSPSSKFGILQQSVEHAPLSETSNSSSRIMIQNEENSNQTKNSPDISINDTMSKSKMNLMQEIGSPNLRKSMFLNPKRKLSVKKKIQRKNTRNDIQSPSVDSQLKPSPEHCGLSHSISQRKLSRKNLKVKDKCQTKDYESASFNLIDGQQINSKDSQSGFGTSVDLNQDENKSISQTSFYLSQSSKQHTKRQPRPQQRPSDRMIQNEAGGESPFAATSSVSFLEQKSSYLKLVETSLKVSQYRQFTQDMFLQIYKIKELMNDDYQDFPEELKIPFTFKKPGFTRLLIFDLDETLIHVKRDQTDEGCDEEENFDPEEEIFIKDPKTGEDIVAGFSIRPFTRECLKFVNKHFEVAIFTAGHQWFADKIIDFLDPNGTLIQHRFFRQHTCQLGEDEECLFVKDLSIFKGDITLDDILIIDNNIYSFAFNLENGIPILNFMGDKRDTELLKAMAYLNQLKDFDNLRVANESHQKLLEIFNSNIEEYIQYYDSDGWSESEAEDDEYDEDGITAKSMSRMRKQSSYDENRMIFGSIANDSPNQILFKQANRGEDFKETFSDALEMQKMFSQKRAQYQPSVSSSSPLNTHGIMTKEPQTMNQDLRTNQVNWLAPTPTGPLNSAKHQRNSLGFQKDEPRSSCIMSSSRENSGFESAVKKPLESEESAQFLKPEKAVGIEKRRSQRAPLPTDENRLTESLTEHAQSQRTQNNQTSPQIGASQQNLLSRSSLSISEIVQQHKIQIKKATAQMESGSSGGTPGQELSKNKQISHDPTTRHQIDKHLSIDQPEPLPKPEKERGAKTSGNAANRGAAKFADASPSKRANKTMNEAKLKFQIIEERFEQLLQENDQPLLQDQQPKNIRTSPSPNDWNFHPKRLEDQLEQQSTTGDNDALKRKRAMAKRAKTAGELGHVDFGAKTASKIHSRASGQKLNNLEQPKKIQSFSKIEVNFGISQELVKESERTDLQEHNDTEIEPASSSPKRSPGSKLHNESGSPYSEQKMTDRFDSRMRQPSQFLRPDRTTGQGNAQILEKEVECSDDEEDNVSRQISKVNQNLQVPSSHHCDSRNLGTLANYLQKTTESDPKEDVVIPFPRGSQPKPTQELQLPDPPSNEAPPKVTLPQMKLGLTTAKQSRSVSRTKHQTLYMNPNIMIKPPDWKKHRDVIRMRSRLNCLSQSPNSNQKRTPSPSRGGKRLKQIGSVLDRLQDQMAKYWESGAMKNGLMKNNPSLNETYILSDQDSPVPSPETRKERKKIQHADSLPLQRGNNSGKGQTRAFTQMQVLNLNTLTEEEKEKSNCTGECTFSGHEFTQPENQTFGPKQRLVIKAKKQSSENGEIKMHQTLEDSAPSISNQPSRCEVRKIESNQGLVIVATSSPLHDTSNQTTCFQLTCSDASQVTPLLKPVPHQAQEDKAENPSFQDTATLWQELKTPEYGNQPMSSSGSIDVSARFKTEVKNSNITSGYLNQAVPSQHQFIQIQEGPDEVLRTTKHASAVPPRTQQQSLELRKSRSPKKRYASFSKNSTTSMKDVLSDMVQNFADIDRQLDRKLQAKVQQGLLSNHVLSENSYSINDIDLSINVGQDPMGIESYYRRSQSPERNLRTPQSKAPKPVVMTTTHQQSKHRRNFQFDNPNTLELTKFSITSNDTGLVQKPPLSTTKNPQKRVFSFTDSKPGPQEELRRKRNNPNASGSVQVHKSFGWKQQTQPFEYRPVHDKDQFGHFSHNSVDRRPMNFMPISQVPEPKSRDTGKLFTSLDIRQSPSRPKNYSMLSSFEPGNASNFKAGLKIEESQSNCTSFLEQSS